MRACLLEHLLHGIFFGSSPPSPLSGTLIHSSTAGTGNSSTQPLSDSHYRFCHQQRICFTCFFFFPSTHTHSHSSSLKSSALLFGCLEMARTTKSQSNETRTSGTEALSTSSSSTFKRSLIALESAPSPTLPVHTSGALNLCSSFADELLVVHFCCSAT